MWGVDDSCPVSYDGHVQGFGLLFDGQEVMKASDLKKLRARDSHCWHCGEVNDLVPHHRMNRQMGGSKLRDGLDNIILVCAAYNGAMESNALVAKDARMYGHKLSSWQDYGEALFDRAEMRWYRLDAEGGKHLIPIRDTPE